MDRVDKVFGVALLCSIGGAATIAVVQTQKYNEQQAMVAEETPCDQQLITREECTDIYVRKLSQCFQGPDEIVPCDCACIFDQDGDDDVDLRDFAEIQMNNEYWFQSYIWE